MTHLLHQYGLALLAFVILLESCGVPVPGETALIGAALLASRGNLSIAAVIAVAAASAAVGGMIGFEVGRRGGRRLLERWPRIERRAKPALEASERFFERHGSKTVFLARFLPVLRVTAAWMAGLGRMSWLRFALWNLTGSIAWALVVGLVVYWAGDAAARGLEQFGVYGAIAVAVLIVLGIGGLHLWRKRLYA